MQKNHPFSCEFGHERCEAFGSALQSLAEGAALQNLLHQARCNMAERPGLTAQAGLDVELEFQAGAHQIPHALKASSPLRAGTSDIAVCGFKQPAGQRRGQPGPRSGPRCCSGGCCEPKTRSWGGAAEATSSAPTPAASASGARLRNPQAKVHISGLQAEQAGSQEGMMAQQRSSEYSY